VEIEILSPDQIADVLAKLEGHNYFPSSPWRSQPAYGAASCWH
jgi:hypothetical protein